ncbi:hypothetical protein CW745_13935 [Psychromonas sp. psych-6C06]|nr:hypothetical protein CW745_13935 [Psychromonas sp. psych-6C06]
MYVKTLSKLLLISLVSLAMASCVNQQSNYQGCQPTYPQLVWISTAEGQVTTANGVEPVHDGGVYLPPQSLAELLNYMEDVSDCLREQ